jgi:HSP20 family protein
LRKLKGEIIMFDVMFPSIVAKILSDNVGHGQPKVDITESAQSFTFNFEIPGALKDDIKVWIDNDILTVTGEKKSPLLDGQKTLYSGRDFGKIERTFRLPQHVDRNNVKAALVDGVLEVIIPKTNESKLKEISIN